MGTINAIKLTITSHLFNQSVGILGNRIKKIPPTLIYNLNDRTVFKKFKLTLGPCNIGLLATVYIQFVVLFEPFNLMYRSLKSDFK
jgi:hypothetical protein